MSDEKDAIPGWHSRDAALQMSPELADKFGEDVLACCDQLSELVEHLGPKHSDLVIVSAFADHLGAALRILMRTGQCTEERARRIQQYMNAAAFAVQQR